MLLQPLFLVFPLRSLSLSLSLSSTIFFLFLFSWFLALDSTFFYSWLPIKISGLSWNRRKKAPPGWGNVCISVDWWVIFSIAPIVSSLRCSLKLNFGLFCLTTPKLIENSVSTIHYSIVNQLARRSWCRFWSLRWGTRLYKKNEQIGLLDPGKWSPFSSFKTGFPEHYASGNEWNFTEARNWNGASYRIEQIFQYDPFIEQVTGQCACHRFRLPGYMFGTENGAVLIGPTRKVGLVNWMAALQ